jgi:hypothetical protein
LLINERTARAVTPQNWEEFAEANPDLLTWKGGILDRFYSKDALKSETGRQVFIFPDKGP